MEQGMWTYEQLRQWAVEQPFPVQVLDTTPSTQTWLKQYIQHEVEKPVRQPRAVLAWRQTAGYGQQGRHWRMRPGRDLVFSIWLPWSEEVAALPMLTPWLAFHLRHALQPYADQPLFCKWPNDLYIRQGKVSGTLVERAGGGLIIGTGINWFRDEECPHALCAVPAAEAPLQFLQRWFHFLQQRVPTFSRHDWLEIHGQWSDCDWFRQSEYVRNRETGVLFHYLGVDEQGRLCLQDKAGRHHCFSSGRLSIEKVCEDSNR